MQNEKCRERYVILQFALNILHFAFCLDLLSHDSSSRLTLLPAPLRRLGQRAYPVLCLPSLRRSRLAPLRPFPSLVSAGWPAHPDRARSLVRTTSPARFSAPPH